MDHEPNWRPEDEPVSTPEPLYTPEPVPDASSSEESNGYYYEENTQNFSESSNDFNESYDSSQSGFSTRSDISPQGNGFSTASLILGILSIVLCCCCYVSLPLGALGILFAILSKQSADRISGNGKTGLYLSIIGLVLTIALTAFALCTYILLPENRTIDLEKYMEYYVGDYLNDSDSTPHSVHPQEQHEGYNDIL